MKDVRPKMTEAARDALDKMHHEMGFQTRSDSILAFYNEKKIDALDSATQRKTSAEKPMDSRSNGSSCALSPLAGRPSWSVTVC